MAVRQEIDIEKLLVWAYQRQRVVEMISAASSNSLSRTARAGGWSMGGGGGGYSGGIAATPAHPDAMLVHEAVCQLPDRDMRGLVIRHAKAGSRPDWMPNARPKLGAVINGKGQPEVILDPPKYRYGYCPVREYVSAVGIDLARVQYATWLEGVATVALILVEGFELGEFIPLPPKAVAQPWMGQTHLDAGSKT